MESARFVDHRRSLRVGEAISIGIAIASEDYRVEHEAFAINQLLHGAEIRTVVPLLPAETITRGLALVPPPPQAEPSPTQP
jgi:hypothetical protein